MKVHVDPDTCMGCGVCETIAPEIFHLGNELYAAVIMDAVPDEFRDLVQQSADECPEEAIRFED